MNQIPIRSTGPLDRQSVLSINQLRVQGPKTSQNIQTINEGSARRTPTPASDPRRTPVPASAPTPATAPPPAPSAPQKPAPPLLHPVQKGQKVLLSSAGGPARVKACLGWNALNAACDVDVSAFLLNASGKVLGDDWFVFYGQQRSPDGSTVFSMEPGADRESISVDFARLNSQASKIVFVLTIHEALERRLNFSMLRDAYIRILDASDDRELASFQMDEYYANVTSMMIGEIYQHNGDWKFNAIGNGVAKDLAGLCGLYGVQVV